MSNSPNTEQIDWEKVQRLDMFTENKIEDHFGLKMNARQVLKRV